MRVEDVAAMLADQETITTEQVWAQAEKLSTSRERTKDAGVRGLLLLWRDARRANRPPGSSIIPVSAPYGQDARHLRAIEHEFPPGIAPFAIALLGLRWSSFRSYLATTCHWTVSEHPSLGVTVQRMDSFAEWFRVQRDEAPRSSGPNRMNELLRRIHDEAGQG